VLQQAIKLFDRIPDLDKGKMWSLLRLTQHKRTISRNGFRYFDLTVPPHIFYKLCQS
jgi:hypothetical protein